MTDIASKDTGWIDAQYLLNLLLGIITANLFYAFLQLGLCILPLDFPPDYYLLTIFGERFSCLLFTEYLLTISIIFAFLQFPLIVRFLSIGIEVFQIFFFSLILIGSSVIAIGTELYHYSPNEVINNYIFCFPIGLMLLGNLLFVLGYLRRNFVMRIVSQFLPIIGSVLTAQYIFQLEEREIYNYFDTIKSGLFRIYRSDSILSLTPTFSNVTFLFITLSFPGIVLFLMKVLSFSGLQGCTVSIELLQLHINTLFSLALFFGSLVWCNCSDHSFEIINQYLYGLWSLIFLGWMFWALYGRHWVCKRVYN